MRRFVSVLSFVNQSLRKKNIEIKKKVINILKITICVIKIHRRKKSIIYRCSRPRRRRRHRSRWKFARPRRLLFTHFVNFSQIQKKSCLYVYEWIFWSPSLRLWMDSSKCYPYCVSLCYCCCIFLSHNTSRQRLYNYNLHTPLAFIYIYLSNNDSVITIS